MCLDIMNDVSLLNQESLFIGYLKKVTRRNAVHLYTTFAWTAYKKNEWPH